MVEVFKPNSDYRPTSPVRLSGYGQYCVEKLAGDLLLWPKVVALEILSTSPAGFLYDKLGEFGA